MGTDIAQLHPVFAERLSAFMAASGTSLYSGYRSSQEQEYLYNCYQTKKCNNGNPANPPGQSNHEAIPYGQPMALAADLAGNLAAAHDLCADYKIHFPIKNVEPWHCQPIEVPNAYWPGYVPDLSGAGYISVKVDTTAPRKNPSQLKLSSQGASLIAEFEGFSSVIYKDLVGVETIGYGETRPDIINQFRGKSIPQEIAYQLLLQRAEDDYASGVREWIEVPLAQSEFDALTSFAYNLGRNVFDGATLTRLLNQGDYVGASNEFIKWNRAGGRVLAGLTRRREAEANLFRSQWGTKAIPRISVVLFDEEMQLPTEFKQRPTKYNGKFAYDYNWVPSNGQAISEDLEWRINIHVSQKDPVPGRHAPFTIYGQSFGTHKDDAVGGEAREFQPPGYGAVAIVSENPDIELSCTWDRVVEKRQNAA